MDMLATYNVHIEFLACSQLLLSSHWPLKLGESIWMSLQVAQSS